MEIGGRNVVTLKALTSDLLLRSIMVILDASNRILN